MISIDGVSFEYTIKRSTKNKVYIRVKNGVVNVSCHKNTSVSKIEELLKKHINFIKKHIGDSTEREFIHLNGIPYKPKFIPSDKNGVRLLENEIYIFSKKDESDAYKKVLYDFYKKEVETEISKILYEAQCDFAEVNFPSISVRYMVSMFGNYNRKKHHIKLSSILAKYDYKYIKFILYHELCHVSVFNHSKEFYDLYEKKYFNAIIERKLFKKIKYHDYI